MDVVVVMKKKFYDELKLIRDSSAKNCVSLSDDRYLELIDDVKSAKSAAKKETGIIGF